MHTGDTVVAYITHDVIYGHGPRSSGAFCNSAIRPCVCPMAQLPSYKHAGCLQFSHRRPPEMCGLRTRPRTDVDPPRFLDPWTGGRRWPDGGETICRCRTTIGGGMSSRRPRRDTVCYYPFKTVTRMHFYKLTILLACAQTLTCTPSP